MSNHNNLLNKVGVTILLFVQKTNLLFFFQRIIIKRQYYLLLLTCCVCFVFLIDVKLNGTTVRFINYNTKMIQNDDNNNNMPIENRNEIIYEIVKQDEKPTMKQDLLANGIDYDDGTIIIDNDNDSSFNGNNTTFLNFTSDTKHSIETVEVIHNNRLNNNNNMPFENLNNVGKEIVQDEVVDEKILSMKNDRSNETHYDNNGIENDTDSLLNNDYFVNFTTDTNRFIETVEVLFHDLKYRRVCTSVGQYSTLCMIVRYPFPVPLQQVNDSTIRYPKPVDERFYQLHHDNVYAIKINDWLSSTCTNAENNNNKNNMIIPDDDNSNNNIKKCMEQYAVLMASKHKDNKEPVISMWTRRTTNNNSIGITLFHDTDYKEAIDHVYQFFGHDHKVIVAGASPAPNITYGMKSIFGGSNNCNGTMIRPSPNYNCDNHHQQRKRISRRRSRVLLSKKSLTTPKKPVYNRLITLGENHINFGVSDYRLTGDENDNRLLQNMTVLDSIKLLHRKPGWKTLRNISIIVEYPFAHVQRQEMLFDETLFQRVQLHQNILPEYFVNVSSSSQKELSELGYQFQHMFAFDGIPQFWPTETSGFAGPIIVSNKNNISITEDELFLNKWFSTRRKKSVWNIDYGTSCRGPLPSNSLLRDINLLSRTKFESLGFNMEYYGRTWEFTNLFWFQMKKWSYGRHPGKKSGLGLDCTHAQGYKGLNSIHGYFVQAMIDDYFD